MCSLCGISSISIPYCTVPLKNNLVYTEECFARCGWEAVAAAGVAVGRVAGIVKGEGVAVLDSAIETPAAAAAMTTPDPAERREGRLCSWSSGPVLWAGEAAGGTVTTAATVGGEPAEKRAAPCVGIGTGTVSGPAFFQTERLMLRLS